MELSSSFLTTLGLSVSKKADVGKEINEIKEKKKENKKKQVVTVKDQGNISERSSGETPEYMPSPFGTKLVPVKKQSSKEVAVFKRPLNPSDSVLKKKRKVLSEEKFAEALEKIIQRECFPDLEKLKAQNAYLDAVSNNDLEMMRELHTKYGVGRNTPSLRGGATDTPSTFETPSSAGLSLRKDVEADGHTPSSTAENRPPPTPTSNDDACSVISETSSKAGGSKERRPHDLGLNEFLNTYTSEDDQSFQDIIDEGIRKHKITYAWLDEQEEVNKNRMNSVITLPSMTEQQTLDFQRPPEIETWTYKNKNAVMYIPDGATYTSEEWADMAKKKNEVEFKNTRFGRTPFKHGSKPLTPASEPATPTGFKPLNVVRGIAEGKIGVDGKEINSNLTPTVNGFKIVRTPSPTPGAEDTPFLTWGEIEGTPFRLDASDTPVSCTPGTPYRMIATSQREKLALELAEKVSSRHRYKNQRTIEVAKSYLATPLPRPKTSIERMNSMSPAAQKFAKNLLKK